MREHYKTHIRLRGTHDLENRNFIPEEDYKTAYLFAGKYDKLKKDYRRLLSATISSPKLDVMGGRSNIPGHPVESMAMKALAISEKISLIEKTALTACDGEAALANALLQNAGYHIAYDYIYPIPYVSKTTFYRYRQRFYRLLSEELTRRGENDDSGET